MRQSSFAHRSSPLVTQLAIAALALPFRADLDVGDRRGLDGKPTTSWSSVPVRAAGGLLAGCWRATWEAGASYDILALPTGEREQACAQ